MKILFRTLFILLLAVGLGIFLQRDPGYLLLAWHHWTVEMPLWLGIILLWALFALLRLLWHIVRGIWNLPRWWHQLHGRRAEKRLHLQNQLHALWSLYAQQENWQALADLLPQLRRERVGNVAERDLLEVHIYAARLRHYGKQHLFTDLNAFWRHLPRRFRLHPDVLLAYAHAAHECHEDELALPLVEKALAQTWDDRLVDAYGRLASQEPAKQLRHAENWTVAHPEDAVLLSTLGRLALRVQLWGQAKRFFTASLTLQADPETYYELGKLLEQLNDPAAAAVCYEKGLKTAVSVGK